MFRHNLTLFLILLCYSVKLSANDPCTAFAVPNNGVLFTTYDLSAHSGSGVEEPPCGTYHDPDIWFIFSAPAGGEVTIEVKGITATDPAMAIYTGSCASLSLVGCYDDQHCGEQANPGVTLTNLTPGTNYYIRVWNENAGGGTFKMRILNPNQSNFTNQYNAMNTSSNCVQLTAAVGTQRGCSWYNAPSDFDEPLELEFSLYFGDNDAGADGICLVFSTSPNNCGLTGGGIGALGIPNSVIIEFDTWQNIEYNDPPDDHTSIHINGDFTTDVAGPVSLGNIEDGQPHTALITWDPATMTITVFFDGVNVMTLANYDIVTEAFNGETEIYWGWTASTGGAWNQQSYCFESAVIDNTTAENEFLTIDLCPNESYTSPSGITYTTGGTYTEDFIASNGCESVRTIQITEHDQPLKTEIATICAGESYIVEGNTYTATGIYNYSKQGLICDTLVTLELTVVDFDVQIIKLGDINCNNDFAIIEAIVTDNTGQIVNFTLSYFWSTDVGNISAGQGTNQIIVTAAGTYQLLLSVNGNFFTCSFSSLSVEVEEATTQPNAIITQQNPLDCNNNEAILSGASSSPGPLLFNWSTTNGNIVSNNIDANIVIDAEGTYVLIIENFFTGCKDTAEITIVREGLDASVNLNANALLNCVNDTIRLTAQITNGSGLNLQWSTLDGNIIGPNDSTFIEVNAGGTYQFVISNAAGCMQSYYITVDDNKQLPVINPGPDLILNCSVQSLELQSDITTPVSDYFYTWSHIDGTILGINSDPQISQPGQYILAVVDTTNQCISTDTVTIVLYDRTPDIQSVNPAVITCTNQNVILAPIINNPSNDYLYSWTSTGGTFIGNPDGPTITATSTGNFVLIVSDSTSYCSDTISIDVTGSTDQPTANAGNDITLDCSLTTSTLSGQFTTTDLASDIAINWHTSNGNFSGPTDQATVDITAPGLYIMTVINQINQCAASDTVQVFENTDKPLIQVSGSHLITCLVDTIRIVPLWTNAGQNPTISWNTPDGIIVNSPHDSVIYVISSGTYNLTVQNTDNDCLATFSVMVNENITPPAGNILPPDPLSCDIKETSLTFTTDGGNDYVFNWTSIDGNITGPTTNNQITADKPGTYTLVVTDNVNGCTLILTQNVTIEADVPIVNAGADDFLSCAIRELNLSGTVTNATNFSILWHTSDSGYIVSGSQDFQPLINQSGNYVLAITNLDNGCTSTDTVFIDSKVTQPAFINPTIFNANCMGVNGQIEFETIANGEAPYSFTINGQSVAAFDLIFDQLQAGEHFIEGIDANGCIFTFRATIDQADNISLILPDTIDLEWGETYRMSPEFLFDTVGMMSAWWSGPSYIDCNPCTSPVVAPTFDALLTLTVKDATGCEASKSTYFRVRKKAVNIFVPNAITPGDHNGINDRIIVFGDASTVTNIREFRIFDRWGGLKYSRDNFLPNDETSGWNGYFEGKLSNPGVFVYYVIFDTIYEEKVLLRGNFTILR